MSKELIVIDGHALVYRAHYAMMRNPLINKKGQHTSALFGFTGYLMRLLNKYPDAHFAVTFDPKGPTFRKVQYDAYKANRKPMPEELRSQIDYLHDIVDAMGLPKFCIDTFEADDVIGALARFGDNEGWAVKIVSKDKDLMQLVNKNVHLLTPETGGQFIEFDSDAVEEKMGVPPHNIIDLLAMMGDSADNIPGLPGVGPKTAIKILANCGTVPHLLEDPSQAGAPKLAAKVEEFRAELELSYDLVQLAMNVPLDLTEEAVSRKPFIQEKIQELFTEFEFDSYLRDPLFKMEAPKKQFEVTVPKSVADVEAIAKALRAKGQFSFDTETTSLIKVEAKLVGISVAIDPEHAWYIPVGHAEGPNLNLEAVLATLKPLLEDVTISKVGQNLKYDRQILANYGIDLRGITFDTMVAAYLVDPANRSFSMDNLASRLLNHETIHIEELIGKGKNQITFDKVSVETAARYAGEDAVIPLMLQEVLTPELEKRHLTKLFEEIEMPLVPILADIEYHGVVLDTDILGGLSTEYHKIVDQTSKEIFTLAGEEFNLNSPKQLSEILFTKLNLPTGRKTKTGISTNVEVLTKLAEDHLIAKKVLIYREKTKLLSTYIDAFPEKISATTNRLHTSFNQTVASTGRLSSSDPNLQNIPVRTDDGRKIREAFVAPKGKVLVAADYSQIELRLLAHFSDDQVLIEAFRQDEDIHRQTASVIYQVMPEMVTDEMRRAAKTINFGLMYGMGPHKLAGDLNIGFGEAKMFIETYFAQFPTIKNFIEGSKEKARTNGYSETLFGRRLYLPGLNDTNRMVRENAERVSVNAPVQGTAADIIKIAMINLAHRIKLESLPMIMILQVHDELVFEVKQGQEVAMMQIISNEMSTAAKLSVPLKVDVQIGTNWSEAH